ncbi:hypothetical protein EV363DRAFT_1176733 [Boletus edulis]|nr:hypothetical protein EV363DRAFT_1176733 [Boletus edulis]
MGKSVERSSAWDGSPTCRVGRELRGRVGTPRRRVCHTAVGFARSGPKGSELRGTGMGMEAGCGGGALRQARTSSAGRTSEDLALWLHSCLTASQSITFSGLDYHKFNHIQVTCRRLL